jgi:hypothetical protein
MMLLVTSEGRNGPLLSQTKLAPDDEIVIMP